MVPVILLSDGYIANGSEPWRLPDIESLPDLQTEFWSQADGFQPYSRDETTLARPWAVPGTPGLEHRIGGLEKEDLTGNVSYSATNHQKMTNYRAEKVRRIASEIPDLEINGDQEGDLLVVGWGSTLGAVTGAVRQARGEGMKVSQIHLRHINPFPSDLGEILTRFERILVPEMNSGQLALLLRAEYLREVISQSKVKGKPFFRYEIYDKIKEILEA
jgi:2-oxoglutarate ferredoxin oxidoreductase subunit alpha